MSMRLKGFLAALLLAVAPASMAVTVVNIGNVVVDGAGKSFSGDITSDNEIDFTFGITGATEGKSKVSATIYSVTGAVELYDWTNTLVAPATYLGPTTEDPIGYNYNLNALLTAGQTYTLKIFALNDNSVSGYMKVSAVPLPGAAILFGSALLGAGVFRRRQTAGRDAEVVAA